MLEGESVADESRDIDVICEELYDANPSSIEELPDVSTQGKALKYLSSQRQEEEEEEEVDSLPQLQLNESDWNIPTEKDALILTESDTEHINFDAITNQY